MSQPEAIPEVLSADLPDGVFLLDVREDDEWAAGHAPEAMHVRLGDLAARTGEVPRDREALEALPGVGRKTANVVLNVAFGEPTIAVDTHVFRVANRLAIAPGREIDVPSRFAQFSNFAIETHRPAPTLSEHTVEILETDLGLSRVEIQALFTHGVI